MPTRLALALAVLAVTPQVTTPAPIPHSFMRSGLPLSVDPYSCWFCGKLETPETEGKPCPRAFKECALCGQRVP